MPVPTHRSFGDSSRSQQPAAVAPLVPWDAIAGDLLLLYIVNAGTGSETYTLTGITGWTQLTTGQGAAPQAVIYYKIADGSEAGNRVTCTPSGGTAQQRATVQAISGAKSSGIFNTPSSHTINSTTIDDEGVTTTSAVSLAVNAIALQFPETDGVVGAFSGQSGGTWVDRGGFLAGGNPNLDVQTADMASTGTVNGGTVTITQTGNKRVFGFAIAGVTSLSMSMAGTLYQLTFSDATLTVGKKVSAAATSYSFTFSPATLTRSLLLSASTYSYSLSFTAASFVVPVRTVACDTFGVSTSFSAITLTAPKLIICEPFSLGLSLQDGTLWKALYADLFAFSVAITPGTVGFTYIAANLILQGFANQVTFTPNDFIANLIIVVEPFDVGINMLDEVDFYKSSLWTPEPEVTSTWFQIE